MKKFLVALVLLAIMAFVFYRFFFNEERFLSVLVFSKTEQFRHESIAAGQQALLDLGKKHGFTVDTTEDATIFKEQHLQNYNVVVFLNTTGDVLNEAQQLEFNRFIQAGGGYVGIHAAADTEYEWPWYGQLVGAYFSSHPNDPNVREAYIDVVDGDHMSTDMLPERWKCNDEWYNYKDISSDINVLLNLDESSYEGGTNGEQHPIAWYHEFDGGRAWYTGRGHTDVTFAEPMFLEHLLGGIYYAAGEYKRVDYSNSSVAPEENRFNKVVLADHLDEPMELEMLPNGNLIFIERHGNIRLYDRQTDSLLLLHQLSVFSGLEDGLLGLALDPKVADNHWIYFFYSDPEADRQKVARFTLSDDYSSLDISTEQVLLEIPTQREECCHSAGSLEFGPDGSLYIATGDNTNPHASDGFGPMDERPDRMPWDAQKSAANTQDLRGKILRILPQDDGSYTIPEDNLFAGKPDEGRPEIYVMGVRNPFRISVDQQSGYLYWGDVGPDAGQDSSGRGPRGYDEVNQARQAGFFGWPYFIGNNQAYHRYDFATQTAGESFDPQKPVNRSPNNTGATTLPPVQPPFIWYPYAPSSEFPLVGDGARNAMAGPVFYATDYPENDGRYPDYYDGKLFAYDWMRGWIMAVTMDEEGNYKRMERFLPSQKFSNPTDMIFGPDGDLYLLEYGTVWFSENPDARLVHIEYIAGNRQPVARIDLDQAVGAAPLTVQFSSDRSIDYDGDDLTYEWYFDGFDEIGSAEANPTYTFERPGRYAVHLVVKDSEGSTAETRTEIMVGNALPDLAWEFTGNRSFYWPGEELTYSVRVSDQEDGTLGNGIDPERVNVSIDYLERGFDANEIALGHQAMQEASTFLLGKQLMSGSDCSTCHQMNVKSIGPSYLEIAQKYQSETGALNYLTEKIISGGGGVWGDVVMAPHPQLSHSESEQMAKYILSLADDGRPAKGLPLQGTYRFAQQKAGRQIGRYIFTASYTDKGGEEIGPLTAREVFVLRPPTVMGAEYGELVKAQKVTVDPEMSQGMFEEEMDLIIGMSGGHVMYPDIDLTNIQAIKFTLAKAGAFFSGGTISLHLDAPDGPELAQLTIKTNLVDIGGEELWMSIPPTTGAHDLYFVFENDGEKPITALISLYFSNQAAEPAS